MKKYVLLLVAFISVLTAFAQLNGTGYYRVQNYGSKRYIYVADGYSSGINTSTTSADMGAVQTWKDLNKAITDPASIIYIKSIGSNWDLMAQGTSVHTLINYYVDIDELSYSDNIYQVSATASGQTLYLYDGETSSSARGKLTTGSASGNKIPASYRRWQIFGLNQTDNYIAVSPTSGISEGSKYYVPYYVSFPFSFYSSGMKAYYVKKVDARNKIAVISELTGIVPSSTPVIIECSSSSVENNKLQLESYEGYTNRPSDNQLDGVYFSNQYRESPVAYRVYDSKTMRVLGTTSNGRLGFVTATNSMLHNCADSDEAPKWCLLANQSYLQVEDGSPSELTIITESEYESLYNGGIIANGTSGTCKWLIDTDGSLIVSPINGEDGTLERWSSREEIPWKDYRGYIKSVYFEGTVKALTCNGMFFQCSNIKSIDLHNLDTSEVTDVSYMFDSCSSLNSIDLTNFTTISATAYNNIFSNCPKLKEISSNRNTPSLLNKETFSSIPSEVLSSCILYVPSGAEPVYKVSDGWKVFNRILSIGTVLVQDITFDKSSMEIYVGSTANISANITPENATCKTVTWKSSNENVATVENGVVTGKNIGSATITATTTDGTNLTATCSLTVLPIKAESITLNETSLSLDPGCTYQLEATVLPENTSDKTVVWTSSNTNIASVSSTGLVTAKTFGNITITAKTNDGSNLSATCNVSVSPIIATALTIEPSSVDIVEGDKKQLTLHFTPENVTYKDVIWSVIDNTIAKVSTTGEVTALKVGQTYVIARTTDGSNISANCEINVIPVLATSITLSSTSQDVVIGNTCRLTATVLPENTTDPSIKWSSADENIATVVDGLITAVNVGKTTITATTIDGSNLSATCEINIIPVIAESLSINQTSVELYVGEEIDLSATITPSNTTYKDLIWNSSDESVASVYNGHVIALADGETEISARTTDGSNLTSYCHVKVNPISVTEIVFSEKTYSVPQGETLTLEYTVNPENATNPALEWESNDETVATVTDGVVSALEQGIAVITAKATDGSGVMGMCAVVVTEPSGIFNVKVYNNIEGIYTLDGKKVEKTHRGVYVVRFKNGTTKTVTIK